MYRDDEAIVTAPRVTDEIEIEDFDAMETEGHSEPPRQDAPGLSQAGADAASRTLTRIVPLAYGALLGGLSGHLWLGLSAGLLLAGVFDLFMGRTSLLRGGLRWLKQIACPPLMTMLAALGAVARRLGLPASVVHGLRCTAAK